MRIKIITPTVFNDLRMRYLTALAFNLLEVFGDMLDWQIVVKAKDFRDLNQYDYLESIVETFGGKVNISLMRSTDAYPAQIKAVAMENIHRNDENCWLMSVDDDFIFPVNNLRKLFRLFTDASGVIGENNFADTMLIYPVVDISNDRKFMDYISDKLNPIQAVKLSEEYGDGILGHLKICNVVSNSPFVFNGKMPEKIIAHHYVENYVLIKSLIGSGGFIIHSSSITEDKINLLKNFPKERGHDIVFADEYKNKLVVADVWAHHVGVKDEYYNEDWKKYNQLAYEIYDNKS